MVLVNLSRRAPQIKIKMVRYATPNAKPATMVLAQSAGHLVLQVSVTTVPSAPSLLLTEEELVRSVRSATLKIVSVFGTQNVRRASSPPDVTSAHPTAPLAWQTWVCHAPSSLMVARLELRWHANKVRFTILAFAIPLAQLAPLVLVLSAGATALQV